MVHVKINKTYMAKPPEVQPAWHVIDAADKPLGRLASHVAVLLQGKHKPTYTPHILSGDAVIVINAAKVALTGRKVRQKVYYFHSGYPGGLKTVPLEKLLQRNPARVIGLAVSRMLPKNTLGRRMLQRLKVYPGAAHPHEGQAPKTPTPSPWRRPIGTARGPERGR